MTGVARSYKQYCAVASALDIVGERWTLLVIRDLAIGPKRYKDLLEGLPGMGTNLLAARLRKLEEKGIIRRSLLPPPAGTTVYELTAVGLQLEPVIMGLGYWGQQFLGHVDPEYTVPAGAFFLSLRASFRPEAARAKGERYEFHIGSRVFTVDVDSGACAPREGPAHRPDAVVTTDIETLHELRNGRLSPDRALGNRAQIEGDNGALQRFVELFAWKVPEREPELASP
jgi:DNA-binding HxlR family transcriptional regulator